MIAFTWFDWIALVALIALLALPDPVPPVLGDGPAAAEVPVGAEPIGQPIGEPIGEPLQLAEAARRERHGCPQVRL